MATEVIDAALGEQRAASTASGGSACTTTAITIGFPIDTRWVALTPRNFSTAVVVKYAFNPWLTVIKTQDNFATIGTDYSSNAQDNDTATKVTLSAQDTLANGDSLWIGAHRSFRGVLIDVSSANAVSNTLTVTYWNGQELVTTSATDNTDTGASLAIDHSVTWTVPTAWKPVSLNSLMDALKMSGGKYPGIEYNEQLYWTRWEWSAALTDPTTLNSIYALSRSTAYSELVPNQSLTNRVRRGIGGYGCVEALTDAGTANLIVNCAALGDFA